MCETLGMFTSQKTDEWSMALYWPAIILLVNFLFSCAGPKSLGIAMPAPLASSKSHEALEIEVPIKLPQGQAILKADTFNPYKKINPRTVVVIVPGSGNIS